jgi:hypothetical protein
MLFWCRRKNTFLVILLSFCIESLVVYLGFHDFLIMLVFILLGIPYLILSYYLNKSFFIHSSILLSIFFYSFIGLSTAMVSSLLLKNLNPENAKLWPTVLLVNLIVSIFFKIVSEMKSEKTKKNLLIGNTENLKKYSNFFYYNCFKNICLDSDNIFLNSGGSIENLKNLVSKETIENIYVDNLSNTITVANKLNGDCIYNNNIICLENPNIPLYHHLLESQIFSFKSDDIMQMKNLKVLILCNNEKLLQKFLVKFNSSNNSVIIFLTDNNELVKKYNEFCKIYYFKNGINHEIDNKFNPDIIIDAYIINRYNFSSYRNIINEISSNLKNKKYFISLVKAGLILEDWLLNMCKENILKVIKEANSNLITTSLRIGEFETKNVDHINEVICFKRFYFIHDMDIVNSTIEMLTISEKDKLNIFSIAYNNSYEIDSKSFLHLCEVDLRNKLNFEIVINQKVETIELFNNKYYGHKYIFKNDNKLFVDNILSSNDLTIDDLIINIIY